MQNRNTAMIITIVTAVLCGCCALFSCIFGAVTATGNMPYSTDFNGIGSSGALSPTIGYVLLCLSLIFILVPVGVGFFTLRKKPEAANIEEIPPAS
jgi:hypothetical protein